uniref:Uncharacterized protein n=1 Tax=Tanacetum cinerariifolium TaxID=118510 RepID=A0A699KEV3_TANCI|nr:hypothetical protein [Tanacetum cinerariifolium]
MKTKKKDIELPQTSVPTEHVLDEVVNEEMDDSLERATTTSTSLDVDLVRAATTASSLKAEPDNDNMDKIQSKATPNESSSPGTTSGGGPMCQEAIGDTIPQTKFENVSKLSKDSLLARDNTLRSDEDSMKLNELIELCTSLQSRVITLEKKKTTQAQEITSLKRRAKKLEKRQRSRTHKLKILYKVGLTARMDSSEDKQNLGEDASKQGRKIDDIDANEDITLVNDQDDAEMFDIDDLHDEEVFVDKDDADKEVNDEVQKVVEEVVEDINTTKLIIDAAQVNAAGELNSASIATIDSAAAIITTEEVTLAKVLAELKASKPKVKGVCIQEASESITTTTTISLKKSQDKAALKLQAEFEGEQRHAREKAQKELEANIALIETCDDVQAKIDVDYQMDERLQAEEQQELTDKEKATLFMQFLEKRRKFFAAKRVKEKRNKPPTQAQKRKIMCTYLMNMQGKKLKDLKNKSFDSI